MLVEQKCISRITRYYTGEFVVPKNLYNFNCTLLSYPSIFDWLAAFHLDLSQAILFIVV